MESSASFVFMRRSSIHFVSLVVAAAVVLSACSSTERMAAPVSEEIVSEQVTAPLEEAPVDVDNVVAGDQEADPEAQADVEANADVALDASPDESAISPNGDSASVKGTRACITNNTMDSPNPYWRDREPTVTWYAADSTTGSGKLPIGSTFCAEGTGIAKNDLAFTLTDIDTVGSEVTGFLNNPWIGYPEVKVTETPSRSRFYNTCLNQGFSIGDKAEVYFVTPIFHMVIERMPDTRWKEFQFTLIHDSHIPGSKCRSST